VSPEDPVVQCDQVRTRAGGFRSRLQYHNGMGSRGQLRRMGDGDDTCQLELSPGYILAEANGRNRRAKSEQTDRRTDL
jgi:hypothetical protein